MIPDTINYVPTLGIRPSEMNAVEYLPGLTKDNFMPCILLAPWVGSTYLKNSIERFEKAYPEKQYFLDIDRVYSNESSERPAINEMKDLLVPAGGYKNWINFIEEYPNAYPCIQYQGQDANQIRQQILAIKELNRPYCLRINIENIAQNINNIISAFATETGYTIILEGGWVEEPLTLMSNFSGIILTQLNTLDQSVPIVISCTSFPKAFTTMVGISDITFTNRQLVSQLTGRDRIVYGDWGSARPREAQLGGRRTEPRIDYPAKDLWHIARNKGEEWTYQDAAKAIVKAQNWHGDLGIWGEEMIKRTVQSQSLGINSPPKSVAARINIHIHRQAFYSKNDTDLTELNLEDDYVD